MPKSIFDDKPVVFATMDNGQEEELFSFYPDEIMFTPSEFVGLTVAEARQLFHKKDVAFLQS